MYIIFFPSMFVWATENVWFIYRYICFFASIVTKQEKCAKVIIVTEMGGYLGKL